MGDSSEEAVHDLTSASEDAAGAVRGGRLRIPSCRVSGGEWYTLVGVNKIHVSECDKNSVFYFLFYQEPFGLFNVVVHVGCSLKKYTSKSGSKFSHSTLFFQPRSDTFVKWMRWRKLKRCVR